MDNKRLDILIARIKESGDETAFAEFYELTSKGLFSYLLSIVRRREVAEDLMQDTYVRFRQSVQSYKSGNPAAFLIEIGKNIAFNHVKRAKYETATAAADEKTDGANITLTLNNEETVETVRAENVDGDMILHILGELKGLKFDVAIRKINEAARTLKFVDDTDGLSVSVSGETAESFAKRLSTAFDFSLSIKTISKEDLANQAKKYLQNATSSMSFEQLTAAFAKRKSLLEESWDGDRSIFSDVYYKYAKEKLSALMQSSGLEVLFVEGNYDDMINKLTEIESMLPSPWKEQVAEIRSIDFAKIKAMYDKYITDLINKILNPSEHTSNSIFNI